MSALDLDHGVDPGFDPAPADGGLADCLVCDEPFWMGGRIRLVCMLCRFVDPAP